MKKSFVIGSIIVTSFVTGCSKEDGQEGFSELQQSTLSHDTAGYMILGQGFDTTRAKTLNVACVTGTKEDQRLTDSKLDFDQDLSYQDFLDKVEGKLSAELNLPVVRAGIGAQYAKENSSNTTANSFIFTWQMTRRSEILSTGTYQLTNDGKKFAEGDKNVLQDRCGDEFVKQIDYGASFFVNMKVDYLNDSDKSEIGGKLKLGIGEGVDIVKLEGELKKIDNKKKESVKIAIRARQVGGDPTQLTSILSDNLIECTLSNPNPCFDVFNAAIKYAKFSIPTQLADDSSFRPIRYVTENYKESGIDSLVPSGGYKQLDALTKAKRREIEADFQQNLVDYQRASDIIRKYSGYLEEANLEAIVQIKNITYENAAILGDVSLACFDRPSSCIEYYKSIEGNLRKYDRSKLALRSSMNDLKPISLGAWKFGYPKDSSAFIKAVIAGENTLEDRRGISLKSDNGELIRVSTYVSEYDCNKATHILASSSHLSIITAQEYGIKFNNETFGDEHSFSLQAAFRTQGASKCLYLSMYPAEPHAEQFDLSQPSELRTFVRRVLESVNSL